MSAWAYSYAVVHSSAGPILMRGYLSAPRYGLGPSLQC